ncbi:MAG: hypothetical protein ACE5FS_00145 [Paracoccaceae bacterium]
MTFADWVSALANGVIALSAAAGAIIAGIGLSTWKSQTRWHSDRELARRLLVNLYKYRDAIKGVRNPAMFSNEMPKPPENEAEGMNADQIRYYGITTAYENRWKKAQDVRANLYSDFLEAEAIWGPDVRDLFHRIHKLQTELLMVVQNHLRLIDPDASDGMKEDYERIARKKRDILYDNWSEDDEFNKEFQDALAPIEAMLIGKLGQNR